MTAKEMFEDAGYFYDKITNQIIVFETWYDGFSKMHHNEILKFKKISDMLIAKAKKEIILNFDKEIDVKLFQAINKQLEEFGWNNDIKYYKNQSKRLKQQIDEAIEKLDFIDEAIENDLLDIMLCITKINNAIDILKSRS